MKKIIAVVAILVMIAIGTAGCATAFVIIKGKEPVKEAPKAGIERIQVEEIEVEPIEVEKIITEQKESEVVVTWDSVKKTLFDMV